MILQPNRTVDQSALDALSLWLELNHYSPHAGGRIVRHAAAEGTPTGSPYLDPEDEAGATGAFLRALAPVPYDDPSWDADESVILDVRMLIDGTHPWPIPTDGDDDDDGRTVPPDAVLVPPELEPEFNPTAEDEADYARWSADLEARRGGMPLALPPLAGGAPDPVAEARAWCDRHPLSEFNAIRID